MDEEYITVKWTVECKCDFWEDEIQKVHDYYNLLLEEYDEEEITLIDAVQGYFDEERDTYLSKNAAEQIANFIKEHEET